MNAHPGKRTLVVGVDGSTSSIEALTWALRDAQSDEAQVHVVMAWRTSPDLWVVPEATNGWVPMSDAQYAKQARTTLGHILSQHVLSQYGDNITSEVREGAAAQVLLDTAAERNADVLVVGSRGHGTVAGMLLGSVSEYCIGHAPCTVVVVRHQH